MNLADYMDKDKLARYLEKKIVHVNHHPDKNIPIDLYCYGRKAVYDNIWDDVTTRCRGLIVNRDTDHIISRPFEKFFAYETQGRKETYDRNVMTAIELYGPPVITEKINGNLGIFWKIGLHWGVSSKGSLTSPHARWAEKWMSQHLEERGRIVWPVNFTPMFEMICQDIQPHCIKYPKDQLVLLSLINNDTGEEMGRQEFMQYAIRNDFTVPMEYMIDLDYALQFDRPGHEGYVATINRPGMPPIKLKIKHSSFIEARKKFYAELDLDKLNVIKDDTLYNQIFSNVQGIVLEAFKTCTTRQEFATFFLRPENQMYAPACFSMLDTNSIGKHRAIIEKLVAKLQETKEANEGISSSDV